LNSQPESNDEKRKGMACKLETYTEINVDEIEEKSTIDDRQRLHDDMVPYNKERIIENVVFAETDTRTSKTT
jgi:hypothetical protein